jgi:hypothetical protein
MAPAKIRTAATRTRSFALSRLKITGAFHRVVRKNRSPEMGAILSDNDKVESISEIAAPVCCVAKLK